MTRTTIFSMILSTVLVVAETGPLAAQPPNANRFLQAFRDKVSVKADMEYAKAGAVSLTLDVYKPMESAQELLPCIVWIHGGGWQSGNKSSGLQRVGKWVASGEYVGVSVGYRLTDVASWPAQIHDCKAAIRYLRAKSAELGIDPDRIGVWGSSAGGHLVSLLGTSGDVPELDGDLGVTGVSSQVTCVVDFCGPSDFLRFTRDNPGESSEGRPVYKLFAGPLEERLDAAKQASPATHVSKNDPPFLIVHGTEDKTVPLDQALSFYELQKKAGMDSTLLKIEGMGHGIGGPDVEKTVKDFFDKHLKASPSLGSK
jgi:acetyl esterase/lipase